MYLDQMGLLDRAILTARQQEAQVRKAQEAMTEVEEAIPDL